MNKIVKYLNNNIVGGVVLTDWILNSYSRDKSPLRIKPKAVAFPQETIDIRKILKLTNQLAAKGQTFGITARGSGNDKTGAAIGNGIVLDLSRNLNKILDFDPNQGLIHAQAGTTLDSLTKASIVHNLEFPVQNKNTHKTLGGLLANNTISSLPAKLNDATVLCDQIEVVLSDGEVIQSKRITKKELQKKIGLGTFEGEIYRKLDNLIEDNLEIIKRINTEIPDNSGYANIAKVKQLNGSFDLTPLFIGSQGTLGVISEAIIKLKEIAEASAESLMYFRDLSEALDAMDELSKLQLKSVRYFDARLFKQALKEGKKFDSLNKAISELGGVPSICISARYEGKNERAVLKIASKIENICKKSHGSISLSTRENIKTLGMINLLPFEFTPSDQDLQNIPLLRGIYLPTYRLNDFLSRVKELEAKYGLSFTFWGSANSNLIHFRTMLNPNTVSDKQKAFKLIDEFNKLVIEHSGVLCADSGEGRLKTPFVTRTQDVEIQKLYQEIKNIFDPYNILNPGVKFGTEIKDIASKMTNDYYDGIRF